MGLAFLKEVGGKMQSPSGLTSHMVAPKTLQATGSYFSPALTCIGQAGLQFADRVSVSCGLEAASGFCLSEQWDAVHYPPGAAPAEAHVTVLWKQIPDKLDNGPVIKSP